MENTIHMMYPDMMHILIQSHHDYLRSLKHDSFVDEILHVGRLLGRGAGTVMILAGEWLAGNAPRTVVQEPQVTIQKP